MQKKAPATSALAAIAMLLASASASAVPTIFDVNRMIDGVNAVTGTITTDDAGNIVGFSLNLFDGIDAFTLSSDSGGVFQVFGVNHLSATADSLAFNFAGDDFGAIAFGQETPAGSGLGWAWGFVNGASTDPLLPCEDCELIAHSFADIETGGVGSHDVTQKYEGSLVFASARNPQVEAPVDPPGPAVGIPEPGTLGLLGLGLAVIGLSRRRKKT